MSATTETDESGVARLTITLANYAGPGLTSASLLGSSKPPVHFTSVALVQGAWAITAVSSNEPQVDTVLATLASPYQVSLNDHLGQPVEGVSVQWSIVVGQGSFANPTTLSDENGVARNYLTLGPHTGPVMVAALVAGLRGSPRYFSAEALPGAAVDLIKVGGDAQIGAIGGKLAPYLVRARDSYGNFVPEVSVTWAVTAGGGSIEPLETTTDSVGVAWARQTLGPSVGTHAATVSFTGVSGSPQVAFSATAADAAVSIANGAGAWDYDVLPGFDPLELRIAGGSSVVWKWECPECGSEFNVTFEDDPAFPTSSPTQLTGTHVRTFTAPGVYRYRCTLHSTSFSEGMVGQVIVE